MINRGRLIGRQNLLGHDVIDRDHLVIADCWMRAANCEQIQVPFFMARLKKALRENFAHEAELLKRAGGILCKCHRQEHQALLDLCNRVNGMSGKNWRKARARLRNEFPKLLREHIVCMDSLAVLFINTNGEIGRSHQG